MCGMGLAAHALNPERSSHARVRNSIERPLGDTLGAEPAAFAQKINAQLLLCSKILLCVLFPHQALRDHLGNLWGHDLPPPGVQSLRSTTTRLLLILRRSFCSIRKNTFSLTGLLTSLGSPSLPHSSEAS